MQRKHLKNQITFMHNRSDSSPVRSSTVPALYWWLNRCLSILLTLPYQHVTNTLYLNWITATQCESSTNNGNYPPRGHQGARERSNSLPANYWQFTPRATAVNVYSRHHCFPPGERFGASLIASHKMNRHSLYVTPGEWHCRAGRTGLLRRRRRPEWNI